MISAIAGEIAQMVIAKCEKINKQYMTVSSRCERTLEDLVKVINCSI